MRAAGPWLAGAVGTAVFFPTAFFGSAQFLERDMFRVAYPLRRYLVQRVADGHWPEWFPDDALGQPFVGMLVSGALHPLNLLYAALPFDAAFRWAVLLSFALAFGCTFALARALGAPAGGAALAAVAYTFGGFTVGITNNLPYLLSATALPGALLAADAWARHPGALRLLAAGLASACMLYAGDALLFLTGLAVATVWVSLRGTGVGPRASGRGGLWRGLVFLSAALALSAAQLLPTAAVAGGAEMGQNPYTLAVHWSGHPLLLVEAVLGPLFLDEQGAMLAGVPVPILGYAFAAGWVPSHAMGAVAVLLAIWHVPALARKRTGRVALGVFAIVLAGWFGRFTPLWELVRDALPPTRALRYPDKLWPLIALGLALAAGLGLARARSSARLVRATGGLALLFLALGLLERGPGPARALFAQALPGALPEALVARLGENVTSALLLSAVGLGLFWLWLKAGRFDYFPAALCFAALWFGNEATARLADPEWVHQPPRHLREAWGGTLPPRGVSRFVSSAVFGTIEGGGLDPATGFLIANAAALHPATGSLFDLESANLYLPALTSRFSVLSPAEPAFDAPFNVHFRVESKRSRSTAYEVVGEFPFLELVVSKVPSPAPRAYLAWPRCVPDAQAAASFIRGPGYRPGRDAVMECDGPELRDGHPGTASIARYEPEVVEVDIDANPGAVLVLSDAYWPGWTVTIDGVGAEIVPANVAVRGVRVPPGRHRVRFIFRHPGLRAGVAVTAGSAVCLLALAAFQRRARRAAARAQATRPDSGDRPA